jgi:hypothetical protein
VVLVALVAACSLVGRGSTTGGRDQCWGDSDPRVGSLIKGWLDIDLDRPALNTPEGERLLLSYPLMSVRSDDSALVLVDRNGATVAMDGELVVLWGGVGSDETMVVCAVEQRIPV